MLVVPEREDVPDEREEVLVLEGVALVPDEREEVLVLEDRDGDEVREPVVVRPEASVVLIVVRVVPDLFTRV